MKKITSIKQTGTF